MNISDETRKTRESSFGWMIQRIAATLNRRMADRLADLELSVPSFAVMMGVLEHGPVTQSEIGKRFGMPAYAISRALDTLERLGYVDRNAHATSRRAHSIQATAAGLELAPKLHAIVREVNTELTADLSDGDRVMLGDLLTRLLPRSGC